MQVLKFFKPGCEPCRALSQIMTLLKIELDVKEVDVSKEENKELMERYGIKAVPVLVNPISGSKLTGVKPTDVIEDWVANETD